MVEEVSQLLEHTNRTEQDEGGSNETGSSGKGRRSRNVAKLNESESESESDRESNEDRESSLSDQSEELEKDRNHQEVRTTVIVHVGCAKGKHRSVAMVERLSKHPWIVKGERVAVSLTHRDLRREGAMENKRTKMDQRSKDRQKKGRHDETW
eukprot:TRINITY_DN4687_c0_g1_i2.p1 TRINITY_DN4687_c0_g1~~TRINITY_DN4687_c0_g1_i2.p1  ORF type:complete len:153 (+),score=18.70 TRINITY_DN4687_c0_g1_i2:274-732(+)